MDLRLSRVLAAAGAVTLLAACGERGETPEEVSVRFWDAFQEQNFEGARNLTVDATVADLRKLSEAYALEQFAFADSLSNESSAVVPTRAVLAPAGRDLDFYTHLQLVEETGWRVELRTSQRDLTRQALAGSFEGVQESLRQSSQALVEEFEQRALQASEALREALEGLERALTSDDERRT